MVAVANERSDSGCFQLLQAFGEPQLCAQTAVCGIIDVSGNQECINTFGDTELNDIFIGPKCSLVQFICDMGGRDRSESRERAVKMQVGCVYKSQSWHGYTSCAQHLGPMQYIVSDNAFKGTDMIVSIEPPFADCCMKTGKN